MTNISSHSPVGIIAGWGRFPIEVAEAIVREGRDVCCIAIKGHASNELESICRDVHWLGVGKVGGHIRYFRRQGVKQVTMAGKLFKSDILFQGSVWLKHLPDLHAIRTFGPLLFGRKRDARDDRLLMAVTNTYIRSGMQICAATDFAPELLVKHGTLVGKSLNSRAQRDVQIGWQVARQMGGMDIGQSITIKDGTVIAVEAIEGTDACIERTGELCRRGGWTLVKVSKPNQDMRFDVPTIGPQTIERVAKAGGTVIAIEAGKTIVVDQTQTYADARRNGVTIVAMKQSDITSIDNQTTSASETNVA
ncbi:LpxI family protein [Novipirellula sp. SH528]|uniref:LpxI family protein n=1 Tax=Novipirellula sp. SH528 TaxID=3454466 RepID=UPI003FA05943